MGKFGGEKAKALKVALDPKDPNVLKQRERVQKLNKYLQPLRIEGLTHRGFQRIFNEVDPGSFAWQRGGRLYSVGEGNYQLAKKEERLLATINGQPVVELDVGASHLTILHAVSGVPLGGDGDPYQVGDLPRELVKDFVTMTLGHNKLHRVWPKKLQDKWDGKLGVSLKTAYPLKATAAAIITALPVLRGWGDSKVRWADLHFIESEAIFGAVEELAYTHNIPSLPVHDSIIVPMSAEDIAREVLTASFYKVIGVRPRLTVSRKRL
jgi:hypothetical protein